MSVAVQYIFDFIFFSLLLHQDWEIFNQVADVVKVKLKFRIDTTILCHIHFPYSNRSVSFRFKGSGETSGTRVENSPI